jgi:heptaprenyl diphosphate synthase
MTGLQALLAPRVGPVGVSVVGAVGHATGQLLVAWLLLVRHDGLWMIYPFLLLFSFLSGLANGVAADLLIDFLRQQPAFQSPDSSCAANSRTSSAETV